mmetsp:Transcript_28590/g.46907  ORF Transcript_28590/g.46907 Transcript_28590/m.46907 type:complete len:279 (-) Transcript_28590:20-856(-)
MFLLSKNDVSPPSRVWIGIIGMSVGIVAGVVLTRAYIAKHVKSSSLALRRTYTPGETPLPPNQEFGRSTKIFDTDQLQSCYHLMISSVTPRPIALVSSRHPDTNIDNVAPFSYFGVVAHKPPMLAIGFCRQSGQKKDTLVNIEQSKQFCVNIMSEWYLDAANHTCGEFASNVDEFTASGLTKAACQVVNAPRVQQAGVSYECELEYIHRLVSPKDNQPTTEIVLARVVRVHVDESLLIENYNPQKPRLETNKLRPLGRLGGNVYCTLGELIDIPRPKV